MDLILTETLVDVEKKFIEVEAKLVNGIIEGNGNV